MKRRTLLATATGALVASVLPLNAESAHLGPAVGAPKDPAIDLFEYYLDVDNPGSQRYFNTYRTSLQEQWQNPQPADLLHRLRIPIGRNIIGALIPIQLGTKLKQQYGTVDGEKPAGLTIHGTWSSFHSRMHMARKNRSLCRLHRPMSQALRQLRHYIGVATYVHSGNIIAPNGSGESGLLQGVRTFRINGVSVPTSSVHPSDVDFHYFAASVKLALWDYDNWSHDADQLSSEFKRILRDPRLAFVQNPLLEDFTTEARKIVAA